MPVSVLLILQGCGGGGSHSPPPPPQTYTVGGAASGLSGSGLILTLNGGSDLAVGASGGFAFPTGLVAGTSYTVAVKAQPIAPYQSCVVSNGTGTIGTSAIANVSVACTTNKYSVAGAVQGLVGSGLILRLNNNVSLPVSADGNFAFPGPLDSGSNFSVTFASQPTAPFQTCVAADSSGTIGGSDTNIAVTCTTDTFSVGGTVAGLTGSDLVLQLNGTDNLLVASNGAFAFPNELLRGAQYSVTVGSQTSTNRELCAVAKGSGIGGLADVTSVRVECGIASGFVYTAGFDGVIAKYGIKSAGALIPGGPAVNLGAHVSRLLAAPNGNVLYAVSMETSQIHAFAIDRDKGALTEIGQPASTGVNGGADQTVVHPSGKYLYAFNMQLGTVALVSVDSVTGELTFQREVATSLGATGYTNRDHLAMTPDGSHLYVLNYAYGDPTPVSLTNYAVDAGSGGLTEVSVMAAADTAGMTMDPLGRFVYLRKRIIAPDVASAKAEIYPYLIDSTTGNLTPGGAPATAPLNNGSDMVIDRAGRFAYLLGNFNYTQSADRIDSFSIDASSGALTANGSGALTVNAAAGMVIDAAGRHLFAGTSRPAGTFDADQVACTGSTFPIDGAGPTDGQVSAPGSGCGIGGSGGVAAIAVVE